MPNIIHKNFLSQHLSFWDELDKKVQDRLQEKSTRINSALTALTGGRLELAQALRDVKADLVGKGQWMQYCELLPFDYRTADRYIKGLTLAEEGVPLHILTAAVARGMDLMSPSGREDQPFGQYTEAVKALPPPREPTKTEAEEYVKAVEEHAKKHPQSRHKGRRRTDTGEVTQNAFRTVRNAYKAISGGPKGRHRWAVQFIGYLMQEFGLPAQRFEPEAVPPDYSRGPGRPASAA